MNDDMPWVIGLTDEEVQELRSKKQELTQYGKEKIRELMNDNPTHEEMLEEAAKREAENEVIVAKISEEDYQKVMDAMEENKRPFYRFFAVEYFGTGEGMSFWLKACRNYEPYGDKDYEMESFKEFVGESFFFPAIEEPTEEEFRTQYARLIPDYVSKMLDKRDQPGFIWETHYHFNYS